MSCEQPVRIMMFVLPFDKWVLIGFTRTPLDDTRRRKIGDTLLGFFSKHIKAVPSCYRALHRCFPTLGNEHEHL